MKISNPHDEAWEAHEMAAMKHGVAAESRPTKNITRKCRPPKGRRDTDARPNIPSGNH